MSVFLPGYLEGIRGDVVKDWRTVSKGISYQRDPAGWARDVLDIHLWSKQREILDSIVDNVFTACKSANGPGKSFVAAVAVCWFVSVFPVTETKVLLTAPVSDQISSIMFSYIRSNYERAKDRGNPLCGYISKEPKWMVEEPFRNELVLPKRPADQNLISSFQGIHTTHVLVIMDEAGGLPEEMFHAANAVTTNAHARILAIGNPNRRNTRFHEIFTDREKFGAWFLISISAFQVPTFTGEVVHEDPVVNAKILAGMVGPEWAAEVKRQAPDSVYRAQVLGEFPETDDDTFFPQPTIDTATDSIIEKDQYGALTTLGVDVAFGGGDRTVIYHNDNGRVRLHETHDVRHHMSIARLVHKAAVDLGVDEVRIDRSGAGDGVFSNLMTEPEFRGGGYLVYGINGANKSPDLNRFVNARGWHYTQMRDGMANGSIDLDIADSTLIKELQRQPFKIDQRSRVVVLPKREMRALGLASPDHLDAAIYSIIETATLVGDIAGNEGDYVSAEAAMGDFEMAGMPV